MLWLRTKKWSHLLKPEMMGTDVALNDILSSSCTNSFDSMDVLCDMHLNEIFQRKTDKKHAHIYCICINILSNTLVVMAGHCLKM